MVILPRAGGTGAASGGSGTTASLSRPSGVVKDDVMIAVVAGNASGATAPTITDNNGAHAWTQVGHDAEASVQTASVWLRVAGASEPSTYNWTLSISVPWGVVISTYFAGDLATPQDAPATYDLNLSPSPTSDHPSLTTVTDGAYNILIALHDNGSALVSSRPAGYAARVSSTTNRAIDLADREIATAGATGALQTSWSLSDDTQGYQLALRPAGAGGAPTTYTQSVAGSLAPSGRATKRTRRLVAAVLSLAALLAKRQRRTVVGTLPASGALARRVRKLVLGSAAAAGSIGRKVARRIGGTLASAGALTRQAVVLVRLALGGALSVAGSARRAPRTRAGGLLVTSGALRTRTARRLAAVLAFAASLRKRAARRLAGLLGSAGSLLPRMVVPPVVTYPPVRSVLVRDGTITCVVVPGLRDVAVASSALTVEVE